MLELNYTVHCPTRPLVAVLATVLLSAQTSAELAAEQRDPDAFINQQRVLEERLRRAYEDELDAAQRAAFDWGGWYSLHSFLFDDGVESSRTFRRHDLRLWGRVSLDEGTHDFYARARLSVLDFNTGDAYDGDDDDVEGPKLERGIYRFDLSKALQVYEGRNIDRDLEMRVGRDLVHWGTGLALSLPLDQVSVRHAYRDIELSALVGRTIGSMQDFDLSRTADRTRRNFLGGKLTYRGLERHRPFAYAFWQRDMNDEAFDRPFREFTYDSFYVGLGSTGELLDNLRYAAEGVYETGKSHSGRRVDNDKEIEAWAVGVELEYLFESDHRPRASVGYVFGSGDADRIDSPTNTTGRQGNDHRDTSFIGFGYRNTGISFAPRYSNLHMWRAGLSYYPWPGSRRLRSLELGTDWFLYHKHHASGAVSDPTADIGSGYLGWEMDYYANWRIDADLAWTARFGAFFPGKAFSDRTTRTFFLIGLTWSF